MHENTFARRVNFARMTILQENKKNYRPRVRVKGKSNSKNK